MRVGPPSQTAALPNLLIQGPDNQTSSTPPEGPCWLLGRHERCPVRLTHEDVSLRHAVAIPFGCGVFLLDLGSRTGIRTQGNIRQSAWISEARPANIGPYRISIDGGGVESEETASDPMSGFVGEVDRIPEVELRFIGGSLKGTKYRLKRSITLIGSGPRCKVRLRDSKAISRVHACLILGESGLTLVDTLSRSGVAVDGRPTLHAALTEGGRFQIGGHLIEVAACRLQTANTRPAAARAAAPVRRETAAAELTRFLKQLRGVSESMRAAPINARIADGRITRWQARKAMRKDPTRMILDDRFLLMEAVGRGGMGTVYRAVDLDTDETVAVKMPKTLVADPARLRREILISARLHHPHIVRLLDVGRDLRFLVFDFVAGLSLSQIVATQGPQPVESVVRWIAETADALEYARGAGVIHRDIKPANIMVDDVGKAMLLDLGLARLDESVGGWGGSDEAYAGITRIGCAVGTADFMSPEQALCSDQIDARTDIYSLGCTMYAALAGRCPFHADNPVLLAKKHIQEFAPELHGLDPDLAGILRRSMEKQPADRFQTPMEFKDALLEWLNVPVAAAM